MANKMQSLLATLSVFVMQVWAIGLNDQVNANIDYGTFQSPSAFVRPRFRYWAPDASVNLSRVADDIREAGLVGAGGVELLGYYLYGDLSAFVPVDWTVYGWGTPSWKELLDTALSAASESGLLVDLPIGPNQGAGVPAPVDSDGLLWDLAAYNVTVPIGGTFDGILPGWGTGNLVAASTAMVIESANTTITYTSVYGSANYSQTQNILSRSSLLDVTSFVNSTGHITINFPMNSTGIGYTLFAYYLKPSGYREAASPADIVGAAQSPIQNYVQNGSWVVDHFSVRGAETVINFWEQYLLTNSTKSLIQQIGNYMWEDSQEYESGVEMLWTPQLPITFMANHGYRINKYLPLMANTASGPLSPVPPSATWATDDADSDASHLADYHQTLTELNQLYLRSLTEWAQESLGIQFSAQVAYNLPIDMLANIPAVNAPECESLGFSNNIDGYRQFAGPANLAGKRVISSELGASLREAYQQTIPEILWAMKRSVAGSVNQFVIHGYPYSGNYPNTTWPGFTTFTYLFSEMHGRHQPAWDHYSDFLDWTARTQYISQTGVPKIDLAFWSKLESYATITSQYNPTDLEEAGYSYEYLSPDNFDLPEAYVVDGFLAPRRQAFKAMIVRANETLTSSGVIKLAEYARSGLPIIFSGGIPLKYEGYSRNFVASENLIMELTSLKNVHIVPYTDLAATLSSLEILPRTLVSANSTWYTYWRVDDASTTDYVYLYNDATGLVHGQGFSTGNVTFDTTGTPYLYDAWTGAIEPILFYQQSDTQTTIPFELAGNQTIIVAFKRDEDQQSYHIQNSSSSILATSLTNGSVTILRSFDQQAQTCQLSTGKSITVDPMLVSPFTLTNWTLTIEAWSPPANLSDIDTIAVRTNTSYSLPDLVAWKDITGVELSNTSGRGYYTTQFQWPPIGSQNVDDLSGAYIDLGSIVHTARVSVNGNPLPPLDVTWAKADIGQWLKRGTNIVDVVVCTPMGNGLRSIWDQLKTSGVMAVDVVPAPPAVDAYGLLDPVTVIPYQAVHLSD